jgi:trans-2,3-dihydro-3-hydroxyanthranilate isomerase
MPRRLPYVLVDVFTARPLEGNALAVFTDAGGLPDASLQALARETNLSETTFVMPEPGAPARAPVKVRIFTVGEELPFAGHPTLGTAHVLRGASGAASVELDLPVGVIPVTFRDGEDGAFGEMRQRDPAFGAVHQREDVAQALGVDASDLDPDLPVQTVSTGMAFAMVPFRSLATLSALRADWRRTEAWLRGTDAKFLYLVCRETAGAGARLHARMVFYGGEDPATGSAAGCCAAWMVAHGVARPDEPVVIEQGLEVRRPSHIHVRAARDAAGRVGDVRVGGQVVEVGRGEMVV